MSDFLSNWKNNTEYFKLLELMARLSNLFSDNVIPFLHYRVTENLFCKYFNAENLSRSDTAYDAKADNFGVGIKTFQFEKGVSVEKVAEFNAISSFLKKFKNEDLAYQVSKARNERMELGQRLYAINAGCYHIIGRVQNGLTVFNTPYPLINLSSIHSVKDTGHALQFEDDTNFYSFNYSKSTLFKRFEVSKDKIDIPVSIIQDPYELLKQLLLTEDYEGRYQDIFEIKSAIKKQVEKNKCLDFGKTYVILPLFAMKGDQKYVPEKSGLNQWNAGGRERQADEVYIPIPAKINSNFPNFFPNKDTTFTLHLPNGSSLSAKPCQQNRKALMSNPNIALGKWILRDILQVKEGELVTMEHLYRLGFDSVVVYKDSETDYRIDVCKTMSYSKDMFDDVDD
jgi:hypothetical protein